MQLPLNMQKLNNDISPGYTSIPISYLLACDCNEKFSQFVYKPHGRVHTGNLELIENVPLRNIMKWELNLEKRHPVTKINWPIYTEMLLSSSQKSSSFY